jgi:ArsR family transcriptional regulator, arsenate/arsenite/antimonite-responsive transcriptional repressor / arsenate reductase (thioredoxin)
MKPKQPIDALTALGHPGRLAVFRLLARRAPHGVRPAEIIGALGLKPSTLSVHLAALDRTGLIAARRDGKSIYYSITLGEVAALVDFLVNDCCHGRPELCAPLAARSLRVLPGSDQSASDRPFDVLFLCVGNSARSILAEAILREIGGGRFRAFSAGTAPRAEPSPLALQVLSRQGHDLSGLRSKSVAEFRGPAAPRFDFVFTLCDAAANEECPAWPDQPLAAHWGLPDPVKATGDAAERTRVFEETYRVLRQRLSGFVDLPFAALDRLSLQHRLDALGQEGAAAAG